MFGFLKRKKVLKMKDLTEEEYRELILAMTASWSERSKTSRGNVRAIGKALLDHKLKEFTERRERINQQSQQGDDNGNNLKSSHKDF